jgi:hypothetical protein
MDDAELDRKPAVCASILAGVLLLGDKKQATSRTEAKEKTGDTA